METIIDIFNFIINTHEFRTAGTFFIASILGIVIGFERSVVGKSAGLRTVSIVCLGACIFTYLSNTMSISLGVGDPSRLASGIVQGVGFLGAGVIIKDGLNIKGLTTAATVWASASIGVACGMMQFSTAIIGTIFLTLILQLNRVSFFDNLGNVTAANANIDEDGIIED
jgi:putative Mg2+ transporter-C (MgtC) family protein